jgi:exopolyphosphatase/guanosine-5'-triphosphate,3'-diphosphate pyrophosphatase
MQRHSKILINFRFASYFVVLVLATSACGSLGITWNTRSQVPSKGPNSSQPEDQSIESKCLVRRAAIDVGSGSTKIKVATVNKCQARIHANLFSAQTQLSIKENIIEGQLEPGFINDISSKILDLAGEAKKFTVASEDVVAVGTQALREARNAADLIATLKRSQLNLRIISQAEEAELGHKASVSNSEFKADQVTSIDIGGGSFQVVSLSPKTNVIAGNLASISFKNHIVERIQHRPKGASPNPISPGAAKQAITFAEEYARNLKRKNRDFRFQAKIIGVGGLFGFSIAQQLGKTKFTAQDLEAIYPKLIARRSEEIESDFRDTESTNLLLVLGLLRGFGLTDREIEIKKANLADGVLTSPAYYAP